MDPSHSSFRSSQGLPRNGGVPPSVQQPLGSARTGAPSVGSIPVGFQHHGGGLSAASVPRGNGAVLPPAQAHHAVAPQMGAQGHIGYGAPAAQPRSSPTMRGALMGEVAPPVPQHGRVASHHLGAPHAGQQVPAPAAQSHYGGVPAQAPAHRQAAVPGVFAASPKGVMPQTHQRHSEAAPAAGLASPTHHGRPEWAVPNPLAGMGVPGASQPPQRSPTHRPQQHRMPPSQPVQLPPQQQQQRVVHVQQQQHHQVHQTPRQVMQPPSQPQPQLPPAHHSQQRQVQVQHQSHQLHHMQTHQAQQVQAQRHQSQTQPQVVQQTHQHRVSQQPQPTQQQLMQQAHHQTQQQQQQLSHQTQNQTQQQAQTHSQPQQQAQTHSQPQQRPGGRSRIHLSPEAKQALTRAVLSSFQSPTGQIDPGVLAEAERITGLPRSAILNAAKAAREREMRKRQQRQAEKQAQAQAQAEAQARQQQQQQQQQIQSQQEQAQAQRQQQLQQQAQYSTSQQVQQARLAQQQHQQAPLQVSLQQQHQRNSDHVFSQQTMVQKPASSSSVPGEQAAHASSYRQMPSVLEGSSSKGTSSSSRGGVLSGAYAASSSKAPLPAEGGVSESSRRGANAAQQLAAAHAKAKAAAAAVSSPSLKPQSSAKLASAKLASAKLASAKLATAKLASAKLATAKLASAKLATAKLASAKLASIPSKPPAPTTSKDWARWKRVQSGLFVSGRRGTQQVVSTQVVPHTLGAVVRCSDIASTVPPSKKEEDDDDDDGRPLSKDCKEEAMALQRMLRRQFLLAGSSAALSPALSPSKVSEKEHVDDSSAMSTRASLLIDPAFHKRLKLQPRREAKALEKNLRKERSQIADALVKRHRDLTKHVLSVRDDFFRHHRLKRVDLSRLARAARDHVGTAEKKKEKEAEAAEKHRITALRSNDMKAYTQLLEDTRNDRLKFLLDKTGQCMDQISTLLKEHQDDGDDVGGAVAAAAAAESAEGSAYYASAHVRNEEVKQPSILSGGKLKDYQVGGLQWLVSLYNNKLNGILADEMGLGKTVQTIALIAYLMEYKENRGPFLVIVPLSTLSNWVSEFAKWCPTARVITYKGIPAQRKLLYRDEVRKGHFNVLLTTYEYIIKDKASLRKTEWQYAIVDEGHRMKNAQSKFSVCLGTQYITRYRVLLTGTPLQNNLPELWALLNFLLPSIFNSVESFDQWFNKPFSQFGSAAASNPADGADGTESEMLSNEERMLIIHRLHELLRPFMLRRVKSEVLDQLPDKVEKVLRCDLSSWQKALYKQISISATSDDKRGARGLNNIVMQLRKVCNHPYLFAPDGYFVNDYIVRTSGKVALLDRMLPKLQAGGHRILMFFQMTQVMTIMEDYFALRGYKSLRLDGSTTADDREKRMADFNAPDSEYFVFLLSTRAGGLGLNLATADTVVIFDSDWNPMMDLQAQDRAHRIGQKSTVSVFRLITNSPVEEKILNRATEKLNMSELVVEAGKFDKSSVEQDTSQERMQLMEILLTDFDTTTSQSLSTSLHSTTGSLPSSEADDGEEDGADGETDERNTLNELISRNEEDYELYTKFDAEDDEAAKGKELDPDSQGLITDPDEIPDWIRYPGGKKKKEEILDENGEEVLGERRAKSNVVYDDGMTEGQFVRMMENQAKAEEKQEKTRKQERKVSQKRPESTETPDANTDVGGKKRKRDSASLQDETPNEMGAEDDGTSNAQVSIKVQEMPEEVVKKLVSITKGIIYFKDKATKRRLAEIFLEKPCPQAYPDYYEIVKKPIGMNDILKKLRSKSYATVGDFSEDWQTLFTNARTFNEENSWVVVDAATLETELNRMLKKNALLEKKPKPLRIKLSLKKIMSKDSSKSKTKKGSSASGRKRKKAKVSSENGGDGTV